MDSAFTVSRVAISGWGRRKRGMGRDVVSVLTSRSRDGLETFFQRSRSRKILKGLGLGLGKKSNVSVSSRSRSLRSRLQVTFYIILDTLLWNTIIKKSCFIPVFDSILFQPICLCLLSSSFPIIIDVTGSLSYRAWHALFYSPVFSSVGGFSQYLCIVLCTGQSSIVE